MSTSWPEVPLGEVATFRNGGTPSRATPEYFGGDIPWVTGADISADQKVLTSSRSFITRDAVSASAANVVPAGTILLVTRTGVGKVAIAGIELAFSQDITAVLPNGSRVETDYLYRCLKYQGPRFQSLSQGATIKGITREVVEETSIPLPPLEEQRRIAALLDAADELRTKRRLALAKLHSLTQAIFVDMFGDPISTDHEPRAPIGSIAMVVTGNTPSRADPSNYGDAIEWLKSDNILKSGRIDRATESLSELGRKRGREAPASASLVVCIAGSPQSIGRVGLLDRRAAFNQQINAIIPGEALLPEFLFHQLKAAQRLIQAASTNSMKGMVSKSALAQVRLLIPPISSQAKFVDRVNAIAPMSAAAQQSLEHLNLLAGSLQQRAFRGET